MKHQKSQRRGGFTKVSTVLLLILTSCSAGFQPTTSNTVECESPSLGIVWVTGGPIAGAEISDHGERLAAELAEEGGSVRVLRLDQRVASSSENIDLPGLSRCGGLPGDVRNYAARQAMAEELRPDIEDALSAAATNSASLDEGRDILGGVRRMGQHDPDRLELWCTDGCIHRTTRLNLLDESLPLDDALDLEVGPQTSVRIVGAGRIPIEDDRPPPLDLAEGIVAEWERACESLADCEVRPL